MNDADGRYASRGGEELSEQGREHIRRGWNAIRVEVLEVLLREWEDEPEMLFHQAAPISRSWFGADGAERYRQRTGSPAGCRDQSFDFRMQRSDAISLLKERVWRFVRGGKKYIPPGRGGPHQEHRLNDSTSNRETREPVRSPRTASTGRSNRTFCGLLARQCTGSRTRRRIVPRPRVPTWPADQ